MIQEAGGEASAEEGEGPAGLKIDFCCFLALFSGSSAPRSARPRDNGGVLIPEDEGGGASVAAANLRGNVCAATINAALSSAVEGTPACAGSAPSFCRQLSAASHFLSLLFFFQTAAPDKVSTFCYSAQVFRR